MKKLMHRDLVIIIIFLLTPVFAQSQNLVVDGDVKIAGMNPAKVTEYILVSGPGGVLAQRSLNDAIIHYFVKLPKGIQVLLDMGESPVKLINSGVSIDDLYGKMYLGGLIFYIDDLDTVPSIEGLIAATEDQSSGAVWGCSETLIGANGLGLGTGEQNTQIIEGNCADGTASDICYDLSLNGFMDWFLPSSDELDQMYKITSGQLRELGNWFLLEFF